MKVALGLFILRVATKRVHIWIIRLVMGATVGFGGAFAFIVLFQCWPIHAFWTLNPNDGRCIDVNVLMGLTYCISALNVVADWTFAILPAFIVKDLQMSRRQKYMVAGILALAALGSTATVVRLPYIYTLAESYKGWNGDFLCKSAPCMTVGFPRSANTTLTSFFPDKTTPVAIWTTVEIGIGVTAGCIATLRPLLQVVLSRMGISSTSHGASRSRQQKSPLAAHNRYLRSPSLPLDGLARGHGVVTTITGKTTTDSASRDRSSRWHSRNSSQERLALPGDITKHVTVEYDEINSPEALSEREMPPVPDKWTGR